MRKFIKKSFINDLFLFSAELKTDKDRVAKLEQELKETKGELEDIKTAVAVSEANKEEEIAKVRRQCDQEIQTMQALLKGEQR